MTDALDTAAADLKAKYEAWKLFSGRALPSDALILAAGRNSADVYVGLLAEMADMRVVLVDGGFFTNTVYDTPANTVINAINAAIAASTQLWEIMPASVPTLKAAVSQFIANTRIRNIQGTNQLELIKLEENIFAALDAGVNPFAYVRDSYARLTMWFERVEIGAPPIPLITTPSISVAEREAGQILQVYADLQISVAYIRAKLTGGEPYAKAIWALEATLGTLINGWYPPPPPPAPVKAWYETVADWQLWLIAIVVIVVVIACIYLFGFNEQGKFIMVDWFKGAFAKLKAGVQSVSKAVA